MESGENGASPQDLPTRCRSCRGSIRSLCFHVGCQGGIAPVTPPSLSTLFRGKLAGKRKRREGRNALPANQYKMLYPSVCSQSGRAHFAALAAFIIVMDECNERNLSAYR